MDGYLKNFSLSGEIENSCPVLHSKNLPDWDGNGSS